MEIKGAKIPFDGYDTFGYIIPAIIFLIGLFLLYGCAPEVFQSLIEYFVDIKKLFSTTSSNWVLFIYTIIFLFFIYFLGHLIAALSSIFIDIIFVQHCFNYPYRTLLSTKKNINPFRYPYSICFSVVNLSFLYFVFTISPAFWMFLFKIDPFLYGFLDKIEIFIVVSFVIYICHKIINHLVKYYREPIIKFFKKIKKKSKIINYPAASNGVLNPVGLKKIIHVTRYLKLILKTLKLILELILRIFGFPLNILLTTLLLFIHVHDPFSFNLKEKIRERFRNLCGFEIGDIEKANTDIYWLPYTYICENYPVTAHKLKHSLQHYTFNRNLSTSLLILSILGLIVKNHFLKMYIVKMPKIIVPSYNFNLSVFIISTCVLSLFLLIRYYHLYYNYHSKYLFRSFAISDRLKAGDNDGDKQIVPKSIKYFERVSLFSKGIIKN